MSAPASYDLNAIFDAMAAVFNGAETGADLNGNAQTVTAYSEVVGSLQVPAVVLELDDIAWDENMGDGADGIQIAATVLVQTADAKTAQREMRTFLSRMPTAGVARLKALLEANPTLGGLVSYAVMGQARRIGTITYDGVDYLGAELIIGVMS